MALPLPSRPEDAPIQLGPIAHNESGARRNSSNEDLEQGTRSNNQSTNPPSSEKSQEWVVKSRTTAIDIDKTGKCTKRTRVWVDDIELAEQQFPEIPHGCVRILLRESMVTPLEDVHTTVKSALKRSFPSMKEAFKGHVLSDIGRPALEAILEIPSSKALLQYRMHRKFSVGDLQRILNFEDNGVGFVVQTNIQRSAFRKGTRPFGPGEKVMSSWQSFWPRSFRNGNFGLGIPFVQIYTAVKARILEGNRAESKWYVDFQHACLIADSVCCEYPAMFFDTAETQPQLDILSPSQEAFEDLLLSRRSSLHFAANDTQIDTKLTCQLILLDLMRSKLQCWDIFLRNLNLSPVMDVGADTSLLDEYEEDVQTSIIIAALLRNCTICLTFLTTLIEPTSKVVLQDEGHDANHGFTWDHLLDEIKYQSHELQDANDDNIKRFKYGISFLVANFNQSQAKSTKRLTIVASTFLPLTLSATMMAMTEPAKKIGGLWYDWVGLCLVIGTAVFTIYFLWVHVENALAKQPVKSLRYLIRWATHIVKKISWAWAYMMLLLVTASFLVGMFHTKRMAIEALKYGVIGVTGFALLWKMAKIAYFFFKFIPTFIK